MAEQTIVLRWKADNTEAITASDAVTDAVSRTTDAAKTAGGGFDILGEIAGGAMRRIGEAAINAVGSGLSMLGGVITDGISEAQGWQSALAQTTAVITSTGGAAGKTAEDMANLAGALSAGAGMSLFSDDAILGAENVLATFTQIRGENFDAATSSILDMSQAMGMDLQSATVQVGKALNDPIAGIGALSRVGVQFSEDQKAVIQSLVDTGDIAGAQTLILDELNNQFGGSAAAAVDTYAGQMMVLTEQFNDVKQTIGEALLPILEELGIFAVQYVVPAVQGMATAFKTWLDSVDWVGLMSLFESVFSSIGNSVSSVDWDGVFASISDAITWVMETAQELRVVFDSAMTAIMTQVNGFWTVVKPVWTQFVGVLGDAVTQLMPLGDIAAEAFGSIATEAEGMAPIGEYIGNIVKAVLNVAGILVQILVPIVKFVFPLVVQNIQDMINGFINLYNAINYVFSGKLQSDITGWWSDTVQKITASITSVIEGAKRMGKDIMQGVIDGVNSMSQKLKDAFGAVVGGAVKWLKDLLGIASPSKLMAEVIGQPMAEGIAAGVQSGVPTMQRALTDMTGVAIATTTATTQNYYLTANYSQMQTESSIGTTLRMMQLQTGY